MEQAKESWKHAPGYEGRYQVSDRGRVRSVERRVRVVLHGVETTRRAPSRLLKPGPSKSGHLSVALGKGNTRSVHVLVLQAFKGAPPEGNEALHINHTPGDNRLTNLKWGTRSKNLQMDYEVDTRPQRDSHHASRVTPGMASRCLTMLRAGQTQRGIARLLGVAQSQVSLINRRKHWTS